ncbi:MAG: zinc ABC transporter substrate-binding protein [Patescibacteria group bacterium]|jgi:zinc transport system substrate-binding protein
MKTRVLLITIGLTILMILIALFVNSQEQFAAFNTTTKNDKLKIVTSFYPLYFFTTVLAGEHADITNITPAGAEPHDYEPTASDVAKISGADLVVVNGIVEPWLPSMRDELSANGSLLVASKDFATPNFTTGKKLTTVDPHVWLSPRIAKEMIQRIADALVAEDSTNAIDYRNNETYLQKQLTELDNSFTTGLSQCQKKNFITSHDAFSYLADAYGLKQISIAGLSPDAEPSPQELASVAALAKSENIHYVFFESLASPKLSQTIAEEIGATILPLNPLEGLTQQEMTSGKTYFSEMTQNLTNLRTALECM